GDQVSAPPAAGAAPASGRSGPAGAAPPASPPGRPSRRVPRAAVWASSAPAITTAPPAIWSGPSVSPSSTQAITVPAITAGAATVEPTAADSRRTAVTPVMYASTVATTMSTAAAAYAGSVVPPTVAEPP